MLLFDDVSLTFAEWRAMPLGLKIKLAGVVVGIVLLRRGHWPRIIIQAVLVATGVGLVAFVLSGQSWVVAIVAAGGSIVAEAGPTLSHRPRKTIADD